jgi:hypothetical protein
MTQGANTIRRAARAVRGNWWVFLAGYYAKQLWHDLPGPWWVKIILVIICIAIPGPADEMILVALPGLCRKVRARRAARVATS